ncbi:MAG: PLP-dependent cysteine synthase family protein [Geitlerinemataceae cyanobacterium]
MAACEIVDLIGSTPLLDLTDLVEPGSARLYAKCEFMNPGLSLKDRIAIHILDTAEAQGQLTKGDTIVCASSGNTGCSFAMLGRIRGYRVTIVVPESCSQEKQIHIKSLGAKVIVADKDEYMSCGRDYARENNFFDVDQYNNSRNPDTYYKTLGPEIWRDTDGQITHFVTTGSTFGCISGVGRFLKEQNTKIRITLAEPECSNIYEHYYGKDVEKQDSKQSVKRTSSIEGSGKSSPTQCLDLSVIDEVRKVSDWDAVAMCHLVVKTKGLLVGGSSGLNLFAAKQVADSLGKENIVVTILCDSGVKYLSKLYNPIFLAEHDLPSL